MSTHVVSGGVLFRVECPSSLDRSTAQQVQVTDLLGGGRVAHVRRGGRRSWSVSTGLAAPAAVASLEAITRQVGPFGWYDDAAALGNLLSPQATGFEPLPAGATSTGLVQLPDGTIAATIAAVGTVRVGNAHGAYEMVPVVPGEQVTVGAWATAGLGLQGFWRDATGAALPAFFVAPVTHTGWAWREATLTPLEGAAFVELQLFGGTQYALPSIAWGTTGRPTSGLGCPKAVIHSPTYSPAALWEGTNYTDTAYQVVEVG